MILPVVKYGHPVLRQKGLAIERITPEIMRLAEDMIETMYDAHGVGLAAQQIGKALQLAVIDVRQATERPSTLEINGVSGDPASIMPLAMINPQFTPAGPEVSGAEGCLSFPEIYADISRPEIIDVRTTNLKGELLQFRCGGLLSRAIQHEYDHLQGVLFIDRMEKKARAALKPELDALQYRTKEELRKAARRRR